MRQSSFEKELSATGSQGTVNAIVKASLNYRTKTVTGTHSATHDDFTKNVGVHKVESYVNGILWKSSTELDSELMVLNESEKLLKETISHIADLANTEPVKTFAEKMQELFGSQ